MSELKYKKQIDEIGCDFSDFSNQKRVAFRWTFGDIKEKLSKKLVAMTQKPKIK